jgi:Sulfotransferase family
VTIAPIFLLSSPRSGSTVVQRVLAAHDDVTTTSEPWLLLPLLLPLAEDRPGAGPREELVREALHDFVGELPDGDADYRAGVREMASRLYAAAAGRDDGYFLDKTPLYHLIVDEIAATFPDAPLIFLWRSPLAVIASSVELWDRGRWEVNRYVMALFQSVRDLVPAYLRHRERAIAVRYEDLLAGPEPWARLMEGLGLAFDPVQLTRFGEVSLNGSKGDPVGVRRYSALSREPLEKWRGTISNPVRKAWCRRYLRWIGAERLAVMGYDLDGLLAELDDVQTRLDGAPADLGLLGASLARDLVRARVPSHAGGPSTWRMLLDA